MLIEIGYNSKNMGWMKSCWSEYESNQIEKLGASNIYLGQRDWF
jgi:hypothetical protein